MLINFTKYVVSPWCFHTPIKHISVLTVLRGVGQNLTACLQFVPVRCFQKAGLRRKTEEKDYRCDMQFSSDAFCSSNRTLVLSNYLELHTLMLLMQNNAEIYFIHLASASLQHRMYVL